MEKSALKCRVCLQTKTIDSLTLVTKSWAEGSPKTIKDIILFCVPSVSIQDNSYLCKTCMWHLNFTYNFIDLCLKTENVLLQGTTELIQHLPLKAKADNGGKLEKIFEKSIEDGNKIQIIFENPIQFPRAVKNDHTYFRSSPKKKRKQSAIQELFFSVPDPIPQDDTIQQDDAIHQDDTIQQNDTIQQDVEIEKNNVDDDDDDDFSWANDSGMDDFGDTADKPIEIPKETSKVTKPTKPTTDARFPQELTDLLDFVPLNVRCITVNQDMTPDHQTGLLQEGINVLNMSTDPNKKKRVIYLARDVVQALRTCRNCNLTFFTRCDYADHRHFHKKGKVRKKSAELRPCNSCSKMFVSDVDLREHMKFVHGISRPHQCSKCSRRFKTARELKKHQELFKDSDKCVVKCTRCDKEYSCQSQLEHHKADVADAPCCDYRKCKVCSTKFTKEEFKTHCIVHPNFLCSDCGKSFPSNSSLTSHKKNVHLSVSRMCHECGKVFKSSTFLQHHIDTIHGDNVYMCDKCPRQFKSKVYLRKHIVMVHSERPKNFTCETCGKAFHTKFGLNQHMTLLHLTPAKFTCPTCGEGFARKDYLKRHLRHHEKYMQYSCVVCKKSFCSEGRLLHHETIGHDENGKPLQYTGRPFKLPPSKTKKIYASALPRVCNICHKVVRGIQSLRLHYKAHLKIREFWCEKCEITLQTYSAYKNHLKRHEKPNFELSCNICHAYKSSHAELEIHKREVHKTLKYKCKYCHTKFGRKHLLYSHETIKHPEYYAKKENLYKMLTVQKHVIADDVRVDRKGKKLGPFDTDIDQVINTLAKSDQELFGAPDTEDDLENEGEKFNVLSEEYQMAEEEIACTVLIETMDK